MSQQNDVKKRIHAIFHSKTKFSWIDNPGLCLPTGLFFILTLPNKWPPIRLLTPYLKEKKRTRNAY